MKVDGNKLSFECLPGVAGVIYSNIPIRLEIASRILAGLCANLADIRKEGFKDKDLEEFALLRADALIKAHNETTGDDND